MIIFNRALPEQCLGIAPTRSKTFLKEVSLESSRTFVKKGLDKVCRSFFMAWARHRAGAAVTAAAWFSFFPVLHKSRDDGGDDSDENNTDNDCDNIIGDPCKHISWLLSHIRNIFRAVTGDDSPEFGFYYALTFVVSLFASL